MTSATGRETLPQSLARRCNRLLMEQGPSTPAALLAGGSPAAHGTRWRLMLDELFLRGSRAERRDHDPLCLVVWYGAGGTTPRLRILGPEALRSHEVASPSGMRVGAIALGELRGDEREIALRLWRMPRTGAVRRIVDAVAGLDAALDPEHDIDGSAALAAAIVDRIELLAATPGVHLLLAGSCSWPDVTAPCQLLLDGDVALPAGLQWFAAGERSAVGRNTDSAAPWCEQEFAVLGVRPAAMARSPERDIDQLRRQHALLRGAAGARPPAPEGESYLEKAERLRLTNRMVARYGQTAVQRQPVVTPLVVEAARDWREILIGPDEELQPRFARSLLDMRAALRGQYGLEIPSVRVRLNAADLPPGSYLFMLDEIPLVMGTVEPGMALCSAHAERLKLHGIDAKHATNPANGNEASWIESGLSEDASKLDPQPTIWRAEEVIVLHLAAVVRKNLSEFVGLQAVMALLRSKAADQLERLQAVPGGVPRFCGVLRGLVAEEAKTTQLALIINCYLAHADLPTHEIVEQIRSLDGIREELLGNDPGNPAPVMLLSEEIARRLAAAVHCDGGAAVLALSPESTQEILAAVRVEVQALAPNAVNPVVLVDDWRLRPFTRRLIELEFPHLAVLSRREAFAADSRPVVTTICLDATPPGRRR